jgi:TonB family protein
MKDPKRPPSEQGPLPHPGLHPAPRFQSPSFQNITEPARSNIHMQGAHWGSSLRPPVANPNAILPAALIFSSIAHLCAFSLFMLHPVMTQRAAKREPMLVRLIELPAGRGGVVEGTPGKTAERAAPKEEQPVEIKNPKLTLPGKEPPKLKEGPSPVNTEKPGVAAGLGHGGPAGLGGKAEGLLLDDATFEYEWYRARLEDTLKSNWQKPALGNKKTISASVHFTITSAGQAEEVQLVSSSGNAPFDQSVLRAVYSSAPFPKFPPQYSSPQLGVLYTFELLPEGSDAQPWSPPVKKKASKKAR